MYNYIDPTDEELLNLQIYGNIEQTTPEGTIIFSTSPSLEIYGSLENKNYIIQHKGSSFSEEGYTQLGVDKISHIRIISTLNLPFMKNLIPNIPGGDYVELLDLPGEENLESNYIHNWNICKEFYTEVFSNIQKTYGDCVGISVFNGKVFSYKETTPLDYSCFYPYSRISLYFGQSIFNCYFYHSGTLMTIGHEVPWSESFDFKSCLDCIKEAFTEVSS